MSQDEFLSRFVAVRSLRPGQWTAQCPAHDDRSRNTLSIADGGGRRLLHCWAGCDTARVVEAAGLAMRDLFTWGRGRARPARPKKPPTTYPELVAAERQRLIEDRARRFGPYRGESHAASAILSERQTAEALRAIAARSELDEEFRWELLDLAAESERTALMLEAEQDERLRAARLARG